MLISTTICHRGLVREQNEDSCISNAQAQLWLVADGVGGNRGGQVASEMAVQTVERRYRQGASLKEAILAANQVIIEASQQQRELRGMASTIVAAGFSADAYEVAWLGDSRAYLLDQQGIQQLSSDHNVANALVQSGEITRQEAFNHPGQHELTQALGQCSVQDIPVVQGVLLADQCLLLCSDGLSGVLSEPLIHQSFCRHVPLDQEALRHCAEDLLQQVLSCGAPDNISITLIAWEQSGESRKAPDSADKKPPLPVSQGETSKPKQRAQFNQAPTTWLILTLVALVMLILFW